jgi:hypothetical protein
MLHHRQDRFPARKGTRIVRRLLSLLAALAISITAIAYAPAQVAATGNCSVGYIIFYEHDNQGGKSYKFCYATADYNMAGPALTNNIGPLADGSYKADPCSPLSSTSCIESFKFYDAPGGTEANICIYWLPKYDNRVGAVFLHTSGSYNMPIGGISGIDDTVGSFHWTNSNSGSVCLD